MSTNDNITIKFSGNDFFYVSAKDMPSDISCNNNYINQDFGDCKTIILPTVLWSAFPSTDSLLDPENYAAFSDTDFAIYNKNKEKIKTWEFGRNKDPRPNFLDKQGNFLKGKLEIYNINNKIYFYSGRIPQYVYIFINDPPGDINDKMDFGQEMDLLKTRKDSPDCYTKDMTRIDSTIQNSLYTIDKKYKLTMDDSGNLVLLYYPTSYDTVHNCYKKELCKNKEKSKQLYNLENNHLGTDQNYINSKSMYSLELRRTFSLSIGILILFGTIYYNKK